MSESKPMAQAPEDYRWGFGIMHQTLQDLRADLRRLHERMDQQFAESRREFKIDLDTQRAELKGEIAALRTEMQEGDAGLRAEMQKGDTSLRTAMQEGDTSLRDGFKADLAQLHGELKGDNADLRADMASLRTHVDRQFWRLVGVQLSLAGALVAAARFGLIR